MEAPLPLHLFQAPSLPPPQTIESFACKVRYFSIIRFVMGSLSSTLSTSLPPLSPSLVDKINGVGGATPVPDAVSYCVLQ